MPNHLPATLTFYKACCFDLSPTWGDWLGLQRPMCMRWKKEKAFKVSRMVRIVRLGLISDCRTKTEHLLLPQSSDKMGLPNRGYRCFRCLRSPLHYDIG